MNAPAEQRELIVVDGPYSRREEPAQLPVVKDDATSLLAAITAAANNPQMDVGKVERLFQMHQTVVKQQAEVAFNDAMARAQAEIQPVAAKAWNTHTQSTYAKLEAIDRVITPIHTRHGLSISYDTETKNDADPIPQGFLRTVAWVRHSLGHKERHHLDLPPDQSGSQGKTNKTMVQAIGSTNTYARRYLKMMIFNVSTFDDKDGNTSGRAKKEVEPQQDGAGQSAPPLYPQDKFLKMLPQWKGLIESRQKTANDIIATVGTRYRFTEDQLQKIRAAGGPQQ